MSFELTFVDDRNKEKRSTSGNIEEDVQEMGIVLDLPRIYSNVGSDLQKNKRETGVNMQIRYDMEGTIMNYTTGTANLFLLDKRDELIGETIMSLIDPEFLKSTPGPSIDRYFGLPISEKELECPQLSSVTAIRTNGEVFELKVIILSTNNNVITARLADENEPISEGSQTSYHLERFYSSSSMMQSSIGSFSSYGGIAVDLNAINSSSDHWTDIGHYVAGMEEVYDMKDSQPMMGAISLAISFVFDVTLFLHPMPSSPYDELLKKTMSDLLNLILDEAEMKHLVSLSQRHAIENLFCHDILTVVPASMTPARENCKVYIASVEGFFTPFVSLVRLGDPVQMNKSPSPIRYFLFVLGDETIISDELHEIGRSFSLMMSQNWFSKAAIKITTPRLFLRLMDNFLTRCMMLPPPDPLASNPYEVKSKVKGVTAGCWRTRNEERVVMMIPHTTFQRNQHQLRRRNRILHQHNHDLIHTALQQEPTLDELENNTTQPFMRRLTRKDQLINLIIAVLCIGVVLLLNLFSFDSYVDTKHSVQMADHSSLVHGGFHSLSHGDVLYFPLPSKPRGYYELKAIIESHSVPYRLSCEFIEKLPVNSPEIRHGDVLHLVSDPTKEVEFVREVNIEKGLQSESELFVKVSTNATRSVSFMLHVQPLQPLAHHRVLLGFVILIVTFILLLLEVTNRAVVASLSAFVTLLLIALTSHAPSLDLVVSWMDASTLCLLFGMMVMIQMLSTTGVFEYIVTQLYRSSKGNMVSLSLLLCFITAVFSAVLDNATTMLLVAPITIELAEAMNMSPLPLLFPEIIYSNIGGTSTQIGDPPNVLIGSVLNEHVQFIDFIQHCLPCVLICMVFVYPMVYVHCIKTVSRTRHTVDTHLVEKYQIKNKPLLWKCGSVLLTVLLLFFLQPHHHIHSAFIALAGAFVCLLLGSQEDLHTTFELLDWENLVFLAGLFVMVEGLKEVGVISVLGHFLVSILQKTLHLSPEQQGVVAPLMLLWVSGFASCIVDNITFVSVMIPVIQVMASKLNISITTLVWALSFGACFGGSGTLVGAGANTITAGISTSKGVPITFGSYFKFGFSCTIVCLVVSTVYMWIRYLYKCLKEIHKMDPMGLKAILQ